MMPAEGWMIVAGVYGAMSAVTVIAYGIDKRRATRGEWRVPEKRLHLLELLGGWPGALVAQRVFRHKRRKISYRVMLGGIIVVHVAGWMWWVIRG